MIPGPQVVHDSLAQTLRELRARRRVSQEALAEAAGLSRNYVGHLERSIANPSFVTVVRLANALDVSLPELSTLFEDRLRENLASAETQS